MVVRQWNACVAMVQDAADVAAAVDAADAEDAEGILNWWPWAMVTGCQLVPSFALLFIHRWLTASMCVAPNYGFLARCACQHPECSGHVPVFNATAPFLGCGG